MAGHDKVSATIKHKTLIRHALSEISQDQRAVAGHRQTALSKKVLKKV